MQTKTTTIRFRCLVFVVLCAGLSSGCFSPWFRPKADERDGLNPRREAIREKLTSEQRPRIINQIGRERQLSLSRIENIALVTSLQGSGGTVSASQPREKLLDDMGRNNVHQPNRLLDDESTAMVVAFATIPPAARANSRLDASVRLSQHANATSLEGGWLMETSLVEMSRLGGRVREGFRVAKVAGPLVTRAQVTGDEDPQAQVDAVVVGGTRLLKGRDLGIGIESEYADAITMAAVLPAINKRFTYFDGSKLKGIAKPLTDSNIELTVPKRYELDPFHFINVVLRIGFNENEQQRQQRVATLSNQLKEPTTVRNACWELEAMGSDASDVLASVLDHPNQEIRFYAAHSLAYLDDSRAVIHLSELCRREPAFRAMCLDALASMDSFDADDALKELLHVADAETRFGAMRALRHRDPRNPTVNGQAVEKVGDILEIPSAGPPLVAVSLTRKPEVVIFGPNPELTLPEFHYVNKRMMIQPRGDSKFTISHFRPGQDDQVVEVPNDLRSVLQGIADIGGGYGDWVSFLRECREAGYLLESVAINPVPTAGRVYDRDKSGERRLEPGESMYERTIINSVEEEQSGDSQSTSDSRRTWSWYNPWTWGS
jgi:hypothetical protein